jgi:hypothetical protein
MFANSIVQKIPYSSHLIGNFIIKKFPGLNSVPEHELIDVIAILKNRSMR